MRATWEQEGVRSIVTWLRGPGLRVVQEDTDSSSTASQSIYLICCAYWTWLAHMRHAQLVVCAATRTPFF